MRRRWKSPGGDFTPKPRKGFTHESAHAQTVVWLTPPEIIKALGELPDLDPCAPQERPWPTARKYYTEQEDGLSRPWEGFVYCNPPYGRETRKWLEKLAMHGNGVALVFARTDTKWFQAVAAQSSLMLLVAGRIKFCRPNGTPAKNSASAPSVFVAFGAEARSRLLASKIPGQYVEVRPPGAALQFAGDFHEVKLGEAALIVEGLAEKLGLDIWVISFDS